MLAEKVMVPDFSLFGHSDTLGDFNLYANRSKFDRCEESTNRAVSRIS